MVKIVYAATRSRKLLTTALPVRLLLMCALGHNTVANLLDTIVVITDMHPARTPRAAIVHFNVRSCRMMSSMFCIICIPAAAHPGARALDVSAETGEGAGGQRLDMPGLQPVALPRRVGPAASRVLQVSVCSAF